MRGLSGFAKCTAVLLAVQMLCIQNVRAWDNVEMDLFDLVEEVNKNFYEFMGISPDAKGPEIRKAYKTLALVLHPDKSTAPDAEVQFRHLAGIYEVLKDKDTRAMYDKVLVEGLPDWRMPAYYFRRMRKIGLAEGLLYLLVIATGIQYCMNLAAHWERKFTVSENLNLEVKRRQKRLKKEGKSDEDIKLQYQKAEENLIGVAPTVYDTLPFQIFRLIKYLVLIIPALPGMYREMQEAKRAEQEEELRLEREEEEEMQRREEEKERKKEMKRRRNNANTYKEVQDEPKTKQEAEKKPEKKVEVVPRNANQPWQDEDLASLAKYMKKYPVGTTDRWDRIADHMERYPSEVTKMAGIIKNNPSLVPITTAGQGVTGREERVVSDSVLETGVAGEDQEEETEESDVESESDEVDEDGYVVYSAQKVEEYVPVEEKKKKKTRIEPAEGEGEDKVEDAWSQEQQKALEHSLAQYPKGTSERWERISSKVEGKTKEQCMARFRHLADIVKKKKECAD